MLLDRFALLFLLLLVPIPDFVIEKIVFSLQAGSAAVAYWLLRILNVPVFKEKFLLLLPTLGVEVAKECSGIFQPAGILRTTGGAAKRQADGYGRSDSEKRVGSKPEVRARYRIARPDLSEYGT